jgi:hypothetical protein
MRQIAAGQFLILSHIIHLAYSAAIKGVRQFDACDNMPHS